MSPQADFVVSNGTGAAVRSDINGQLAAIVSNSSGTTEPATMYAYQWWADTTTGLLKLRNGANNAWITVGTLASTNLGLLASAGTLTAALGSASTPGITFTGDLNTGIYSPGADQVAISTGGTVRLSLSTTAVSSALAIDHPLGAVGTPSITFTGDLNTGIYSPAADTLAFVEGGVEAMRIDSSGRVGIGTTSPATVLHVSITGDNYRIIADDTTNNRTLGLYTDSTIGKLVAVTNARSAWTSLGIDGADVRLFTSSTERARIASTGELLVGTTTTTANGGKLQVSNGITFPATQVACTDANTLDDYEEGTWTPTQGAGLTLVGAYTSQGFYTKIGNKVVVYASLFGATSIASSSAGILCGGLPFTPAPPTSGYVVGSMTNQAGNISNTCFSSNSSNVYGAVVIAANSGIHFTMTYRV